MRLRWLPHLLNRTRGLRMLGLRLLLKGLRRNLLLLLLLLLDMRRKCPGLIQRLMLLLRALDKRLLLRHVRD